MEYKTVSVAKFTLASTEKEVNKTMNEMMSEGWEFIQIVNSNFGLLLLFKKNNFI